MSNGVNVSKHWIAGAGYERLQVRDLQTECGELAAMVRRSSPHTAVAANRALRRTATNRPATESASQLH